MPVEGLGSMALAHIILISSFNGISSFCAGQPKKLGIDTIIEAAIVPVKVITINFIINLPLLVIANHDIKHVKSNKIIGIAMNRLIIAQRLLLIVLATHL